MGLRIVTWNVNGIRNPFSYEPWRSKRTFASMFDILEADIVILQETKIQRKDLRDDMVLVPGWDCYFSLPSKEKGKFGVVIYTRQATCAAVRAEEGLSGTLKTPNSTTSYSELPEDQQIGGYPTLGQLVQAPEANEYSVDLDNLDSEGRCVILEFPAFVLFGVYAPATRDSNRNLFKLAYMNLLDVRIRNLIKMGKRVVLTGDLNVSKDPIDVANCEIDLAKEGITVEEHYGNGVRRMFNSLVIGGNLFGKSPEQGREEQVLWDVCRGFHPDRTGMYTHWETKINARPANYGSRIDYILCSPDMRQWFSDSNIQEGLHGSDHCPVFAVMRDKISIDGKEVHTLDVMNPDGMFKEGKRLRPHAQRDVLPLSGRLIPDFTGRQSIRDMFTRKASLNSSGAKSPTKSQGAFESDARTQEHDFPVSETPGSASAASSFDASQFEQLSPQTGRARPAPTNTTKRSASDYKVPTGGGGTTPSRPAKKARGSGGAGGGGSNTTSSSSTKPASPVKGQSQISGFFKPKAAAGLGDAAKKETGAESSSASAPETFRDAAGIAPLSALGLRATPQTSTAAAGDDMERKDSNLHDDVAGDQEDTTDASWDLTNEMRDPVGPEKKPPSTSQGPAQTANGGTTPPQQQPPPPFEKMDLARDLEESREGWAKLFSKPQVPLCEHGEPCKQMLSKKQGPNFGRYFYMCARPLGPSGEKERGTQWRCRTFVWLK